MSVGCNGMSLPITQPLYCIRVCCMSLLLTVCSMNSIVLLWLCHYV